MEGASSGAILSENLYHIFLIFWLCLENGSCKKIRFSEHSKMFLMLNIDFIFSKKILSFVRTQVRTEIKLKHENEK